MANNIVSIFYHFFFNIFGYLKSISKWGRGMGVMNEINSILRSLKEQPPAIHDIKIKFESGMLYEILNDGTRNINPNNKGIALESLSWGNILVKIMVYPKTVHIDLGCTYQPYGYSCGGAIEFRKTLENARKYLLEQGQNKASISPVGSWIITQYHFGKDGREELAGRDFEHTWEEIEKGVMRFYSKRMPNGKTIARLENIRIPNRTVDEETELMIRCVVRDS